MSEIVDLSNRRAMASSRQASADEAEAREAGLRMALLRRSALVERARDLINAAPKVEPKQRAVLARNLYAILKPLLKQKGIGEVFEAAGINHGERSSRRLPRYAVAPDAVEQDWKGLAAKAKEYMDIAVAAAARLGQDPDVAVLMLVSGTAYDPSPSKATDGNTRPDWAYHLHGVIREIADRIVSRQNLAWYFRFVRDQDVCVNTDGSMDANAWPVASLIDYMADFYWTNDDDFRIAPALPRVSLFEEIHDGAITIEACSVAFRNWGPDGVDWQSMADLHGTERIYLTRVRTVDLCIAPIGSDAAPVAAFMIRHSLRVGFQDGSYADIFLPRQPTESGWIQYRSGSGDEHLAHGFRFTDPKDHQALVSGPLETHQAYGEGLTYWESVSPKACHDVLGHAHIPDGGGDRACTVFFEDRKSDIEVVSEAPARTVAGAIQRNLAYAAVEERLHVQLDRNARKLVETARALEAHCAQTSARLIAENLTDWGPQ